MSKVPQPTAETARLVHELQVHQIELELQNEELRAARAELEAALAVTLERYTDLDDFAPMSLFTLGRDGAIFQVNLTGASLLGQERVRLVNEPFTAFVADADRGRFRTFLDQVFAAPLRQSCEVALRQTGQPARIVIIEATLSPGGGECRAVALDITERKRLEQQALRAQRMEGIGTLAGGIAHDLNNVLGPIILSVDLLKMRFLDAASQELLALIDSSAHHGADLVRQVLSFARGVEGQRLEVLIQNVIRDIENLARETFPKHLQIRTVIPAGLWTVIGDRTQLHQVLLNLCVNARDAMPSGGTLTIAAENRTLDAHCTSLSAEAKPGPYVLLQVHDTGTGIPPDVIEKIFDPFFTTKDFRQGTGLGLSTTLGIVKSHGGFLQVTSEPGQGTRFSIYLPAPPAPAAVVQAEMPRGEMN